MLSHQLTITFLDSNPLALCRRSYRFPSSGVIPTRQRSRTSSLNTSSFVFVRILTSFSPFRSFWLTFHPSKRISSTLHARCSPRHDSCTNSALHCPSRYRPSIFGINYPNSSGCAYSSIRFDWAHSHGSQASGRNRAVPHPCRQTCSGEYRKPDKRKHSPSRSTPGAIARDQHATGSYDPSRPTTGKCTPI
jgi:hypothetical protein